MRYSGGGSGIRTLGGLSPSSVFKTGAFDHSAKPPQQGPHSGAFVIRKDRTCFGEIRRHLWRCPSKTIRWALGSIQSRRSDVWPFKLKAVNCINIMRK